MTELINKSKRSARYHLRDILMSNTASFATTFIRFAVQFSNHHWMIARMDGCIQNNPWHIYDVLQHTRTAIAKSIEDFIVRLAILLHDVGKPDKKTTNKDGVDHFYKHGIKSMEIAEEFLIYYEYEQQIINNVLLLIQYHDFKFNEASNKKIESLYNKLGFELSMKLMDVREADIKAQNPKLIQDRLFQTALTRNRFTHLYRGKKLKNYHELAETYYGERNAQI